MTPLISVHTLSKSFGTHTLFKNISFTIGQGDRIGLLGQNGSGKTTLLKILMGLEEADEGFITTRQSLRLGYASQAPQFPAKDTESILLEEKTHGNDVERTTRARILLGKMNFPENTQNAALLSGGWKKRLDLARALMAEPDLLFLDEPTNHLDLEGITWLETFLQRENHSFLVVSHDRYFLENVCTKIIELSPSFPNGIFISDGSYSDYMEQKAIFLEAQTRQEKGIRAALRDEIEWLKKSPKARTTKSRSRVEKTYEMMAELDALKNRNKQTRVNIGFFASERETRKLIATKNVSKTIDGHVLFKNVDLILSPGSRLGIVGKNGTGKTTLLKILSQRLSPDIGTIKYADDLKLVYFDQHREELPGELTLREALSPNGEYVDYRGQPIHVHGWAKKFLFSPHRLELPVKYLSGGERARILIARLLLQPADVLFLDEPTNDLDISTLEVMEGSLREFGGAVVLISHDRCLMDRVCTQIIGLGQGNEHALFADYAQWLNAPTTPVPRKEKSPSPEPKVMLKKKLTYNEQRELDGMEQQISTVEKEIASLEKELCLQQTPLLYQDLAAAQQRRDALYDRWNYLENKF